MRVFYFHLNRYICIIVRERQLLLLNLKSNCLSSSRVRVREREREREKMKGEGKRNRKKRERICLETMEIQLKRYSSRDDWSLYLIFLLFFSFLDSLFLHPLSSSILFLSFFSPSLLHLFPSIQTTANPHHHFY